MAAVNGMCPGRAFAVKASEVDGDVWSKVKDIIRDDARFTRLVESKSAKLAERHAEAVARSEATARMLDEMREKQATVYARMVGEKNDTIYAMHRAELERLAETVAGLEKRVVEAQHAVADVASKRDTHAALLAMIDGLIAETREELSGPMTPRFVTDLPRAHVQREYRQATMARDAIEETTLDSLNREAKRSILRTLGVTVAMYPTTHDYARTHAQRWDFQFTDGVPSHVPA